MKLRFQPDLDFRLQAVKAICDLLHGQEICRTEFTATKDHARPARSLFCWQLIEPVH